MRVLCVALSVLLAVAAVPAAADSFDGEPFSGETEFNFTRTTGNTESRTFGLNASFDWVQTRWREHLALEAYNESQAGEATAERYFVEGQVDHSVNDRAYVYAQSSGEDDRFSGYEYSLAGSGGVGYRFYDTDTFRLALETGPGFRYRRARPGVVDADSGGEATMRGVMRLFWQLNPYTEFQQTLETSLGTESTLSRSTTSVTTELWSRLSLRFAYRVRHEADPPDDVAAVDTRLSAGVVYGF
ncbi:DUF481 domain-containing protein [Arhodomonas sp. AD133]|uniref:DUF481 domain-containing protein n=1 Tax=Arhodomonas sp. AD133 TaxID=3415009 RepID=UPI003EBC5E02